MKVPKKILRHRQRFGDLSCDREHSTTDSPSSWNTTIMSSSNFALDVDPLPSKLKSVHNTYQSAVDSREAQPWQSTVVAWQRRCICFCHLPFQDKGPLTTKWLDDLPATLLVDRGELAARLRDFTMTALTFNLASSLSRMETAAESLFKSY